MIASCKAFLPLRPILGITIDKKCDQDKEHPDGIEVKDIKQGYSFHRAGIKIGDCVKKIDNDRCLTNNQFTEQALRMEPGKWITVVVARTENGVPQDVAISVLILAAGFDSEEQIILIKRIAEGNVTTADLETYRQNPTMFDPKYVASGASVRSPTTPAGAHRRPSNVALLGHN